MDDGLIGEYYADNASKLHQLVNKILSGYGGIAQKDYDDFYSLANEVFASILARYDGTGSFNSYLCSCLKNKIKTELTKRNRIKRRADRMAESLETPVGDGQTLGDLLISDFDIELEIQKNRQSSQEPRIREYLNGLTVIQRRMAVMIMEGCKKETIMKRLQLDGKAYAGQLCQLKSYEKAKVLLRSETHCEGKRECKMAMITRSSEKTKNTSYSIASIIKKLHNYSLRDDHPLQRDSGQWTNVMKGNLISDILQGNSILPIIIAEQIADGTVINWLIDGKQRCTNVDSYANGGFKISRNIKRYMINYQSVLRDKSGNIILDKNGLPQYENKIFDIRGKRFCDLPEELKERFYDYTFSVIQHLNCDNDEIGYHIERYNASKPMTAAQKGITLLGDENAAMIKRIINLSFFQNNGNYRLKEFVNGTMERVVTESIMAINFLNDWDKRHESICSYLKDHATPGQMRHFERIVARLDKVISDEEAEMFNSRDSFIWFGLFDRFDRLKAEDSQFAVFMRAFRAGLYLKETGGITYEMLDKKSTKDKNIVIKKLNLLESLMNEYVKIKISA